MYFELTLETIHELGLRYPQCPNDVPLQQVRLPSRFYNSPFLPLDLDGRDVGETEWSASRGPISGELLSLVFLPLASLDFCQNL